MPKVKGHLYASNCLHTHPTECTAWTTKMVCNRLFTYLGPVGEFRTRCDYESIEPDVLSFKKEQPVEVLEARLDGWWKVK